MPLPLTEAQQAELLRLYPHTGNATLAAMFGLKPHQVAAFASSRFVKKTKATRSSINREKPYGRDTRSQRIRDVVAAAGPAGLSITGLLIALPCMTEQSLRTSLSPLVTRRTLFRVGHRGAGRYFATEAFANAHRLALQALAPARGSAAPVSIAPRRGPAHLAGEPDTSKARRMPTPEPAATELPVGEGLFSLLGPGRYLADAPRWVEVITSRPKAA